MRTTSLGNIFVGAMVALAIILFGGQPAMAASHSHQHGAAPGQAPGAPDSDQQTTVPGRGGGMGMGMMGGGGGMGMMGGGGGAGMGMMGRGPAQTGGPCMMGGMDRGMMPAMMSHMMGGTGGMGRMMGAGEDGMPDPMSGKGGMGRMARLLDDLDLTPEQWGQVRELARERSVRMVDLWAQRAKLQIELAGMRTDQEVDARQIKSRFVKIAEIRADEFVAGLEYLRSVRGVLTAEQREKLAAQGF